MAGWLGVRFAQRGIGVAGWLTAEVKPRLSAIRPGKTKVSEGHGKDTTQPTGISMIILIPSHFLGDWTPSQWIWKCLRIIIPVLSRNWKVEKLQALATSLKPVILCFWSNIPFWTIKSYEILCYYVLSVYVRSPCRSIHSHPPRVAQSKMVPAPSWTINSYENMILQDKQTKTIRHWM